MIYINYSDLNKSGSIGIKKKILMQCRAFEKEFKRVYFTIYSGTMIYLLWNSVILEKQFALTKKECNDAILKWLVKYNIKRTYIRYALSDIWFVSFLEEIKKLGIKSVIEFPTIPYDDEDWIKRPIEDRYYREELHKYIDCCTTYSNYQTVFNIPCISLVNGVDIDTYKVKERILKSNQDIVLLAVATMRREHGYERIIRGLHEYYKSDGKRKIYFNLVGDGSQIQYYKRLVKEYRLETYVTFYGFLQGEQLEKIYEDSDIGVGPLGIYKSGITSGIGIKAVEYCIKGLPMILVDDYGFKDKYYILRISNDDISVDMNRVIVFFESLQERDYINDMHQYAVENYSWDKILEPVIEYLEKK